MEKTNYTPILFDLEDEWYEHLEGKVSDETIMALNELAYCHYLGLSIVETVDNIWKSLIYMAENGQEVEVQAAAEDARKTIDKICGKVLDNIDAMTTLVWYIDNLEDGIYWDQVLNKINNAKEEKEN